MSHFWTGFEKRASLLDAAKSGVRAAAKAGKKTVQEATEHKTIDYSKMKSPMETLKPWQKKRVMDGKPAVGVDAQQLPRSVTPPPLAPAPLPPAQAELLRRRKALSEGATPHSAWQEAIQDKVKAKASA